MIRWKEEYAVGVQVIDTQHKHLFEIAEQAEELVLLPEHMDKFDDIIQIIDELKDYVVFHFAEEEKIMLAIHYPKLFSHKVEHQDFIEKIKSMNVSTIDENQQQEIMNILKFIMDWILAHVLQKDKLWAACYKEREQSM